jgi:hypothetical protein
VNNSRKKLITRMGSIISVSYVKGIRKGGHTTGKIWFVVSWEMNGIGRMLDRSKR